MICLLFGLFTYAACKSTEVKGGNGIILPSPPVTEAKPVIENIHGTTLTDPYRWLQDAKSPATRAWIDAQMKYTEQYLSQVKIRPEIVNELTKLERVERYSIPIERGGNYFFKKQLADENQGSIYMRRGLHGQEDRLVDATKLSADQNTSVQIDDISKDGTMLVYGIRSGGADEESVHILKVATRAELPDSLPSARYEGIQLSPDKRGLYYARSDPAGSLVFYHKFGSPAAGDELVFGKSFEGESFGPMQLISAWVTENERYLIIYVEHGVPARRVDISAKDLRKPDSPIRWVIHGIDSRFRAENYGDDLYVLTDYEAPNYRVAKVPIADPQPQHWTNIVPEGKERHLRLIDCGWETLRHGTARCSYRNTHLHAGWDSMRGSRRLSNRLHPIAMHHSLPGASRPGPPMRILAKSTSFPLWWPLAQAATRPESASSATSPWAQPSAPSASTAEPPSARRHPDYFTFARCASIPPSGPASDPSSAIFKSVSSPSHVSAIFLPLCVYVQFELIAPKLVMAFPPDWNSIFTNSPLPA